MILRSVVVREIADGGVVVGGLRLRRPVGAGRRGASARLGRLRWRQRQYAQQRRRAGEHRQRVKLAEGGKGLGEIAFYLAIRGSQDMYVIQRSIRTDEFKKADAPINGANAHLLFRQLQLCTIIKYFPQTL